MLALITEKKIGKLCSTKPINADYLEAAVKSIITERRQAL